MSGVKQPLNLLQFGGCLIHRPLRSIARANERLSTENFGHIRAIHTFGEMFQIIEVLRGQRVVPFEYMGLSRVTPDLVPVKAADTFEGADLALVEPASSVELSFRGIAINRTGIMRHVFAPIEANDPKAAKIANKWLRVGLSGLNKTVRAETGERLLECIEGQSHEAELARAVVRETEATKSDIPGGFRKMQELLGCPIGVVIYIFRYMPDGRPVSFPPGLREEVIASAEALALPTFEPTPLVQDYGVARALTHDSRHYSDAFLPIAGEALMGFVEDVWRRSQGGSATA